MRTKGDMFFAKYQVAGVIKKFLHKPPFKQDYNKKKTLLNGDCIFSTHLFLTDRVLKS